MAGFNSLWSRPAEAFTPSSHTLKTHSAFQGNHDTEAEPEAAPDAEPAGDADALAEPAEPQSYDPATDGWIRVEDHEAALATAVEEAEQETREGLAKELGDETAKLQTLVAELERVVGERQWLRQEVIADAAEDVVTLIMALSKRVAGETLAVHPRALQHLVHQAMAALPGEDGVRVRVRPEDLPILEHHVDSRRPITWVPDPELKQGVVVQTDLGQVEASLESAFEALQVAVTDWLEQQRGG
jgi:flagellar biosynthesis/type III secretory pathway protein FliH